MVFAGWFGLGCRLSGRFGDTFRLGWMSNLGRTGDTMVRVTGRHRHRASRLRSGRFCDTMRWLLHIEVLFSALATLRCAVQGVVQRYQWGVQATLCLCVRLATFADKLFKVLEDPGIVTSAYDRSVQMLDTSLACGHRTCAGLAKAWVVDGRDATAIPSVWVDVLGGRLATTHWWGCCTVGTLRRYHGLWEGICLAYGCRTVPLGTLCDTMRWAWFGPGCQRLGRFGDTKRYIVLVLLALFVAWTSSRLAFRCLPNMQPSWDLRRVVPDDRAAVLKATVEFAASKVGQALGPRRLSALTVAPVAPVVIAKKRAEVAKARPGENAPQAIITCIEAAMRSSSYANGVMVEQRAKFQGLTAKLGPLDVADIVGTGLMGGGTREGHGCHRQDLSSQRGAEVQVSKWWWVGHIASVCLHKCADRHRTVSLSKLKLSLVGHTWSSILSLLSKLRCACQLPLWSPQFGRV